MDYLFLMGGPNHATEMLPNYIFTQEKSFPRERRQKEKRYVQLLSGEPELDVFAASPAPTLEFAMSAVAKVTDAGGLTPQGN